MKNFRIKEVEGTYVIQKRRALVFWSSVCIFPYYTEGSPNYVYSQKEALEQANSKLKEYNDNRRAA